jgi:hypothetical protein
MTSWKLRVGGGGLECWAPILSLTFGTTRAAGLSAVRIDRGLHPGNFLVLDFHRGMNTDFWCWGFCTVCRVSLLTTFREPLWVPYSMVIERK